MNQAAIIDDWPNGGFGLYVHWPFCESKCPYCDFNSHVSATISHQAWRSAYMREIARMGQLTGDRKLTSIFFGGGTPSLMAPGTVDAIISEARRHWVIDNNFEVTLEANPSSVEIGRFRDFAAAGVSRVSLGVQSLRDADLKALGRRHTVAEAFRAWDTANQVFDRTSLDVIYARQHQSPADWERELSEILALEPRHLSLYQLTIESGTAFGDRYARGKLAGLPGEDASADMFDMTQDLCDAAGLPAYEVSNHCRPGQESAHNLIYWRYGDYAGIGPGAHGRLTIGKKRYAQTNERNPAAWLSGAQNETPSRSGMDLLTHADQGTEYLLMSLRLAEGSELARYEALTGGRLDNSKLESLHGDGLIWCSDGRIGTTGRGRPLLNAILRELLPAT